MDKQEIIDGLSGVKDRLTNEIIAAFEDRGAGFGNDRFSTWRRKFSQFLDLHLPGESTTLNAKLTHMIFSTRHGESDAQYFWRKDGDTMCSYIDSLILDVENDEYDLREKPEEKQEIKPKIAGKSNKVFIVHGHDGEAKEITARFVEKLGYEAIILHEQASKGRTIIEKIEDYSDETDFAIVLYTPDDLGNVKTEAESENGTLNNRARQNVVFEHGFLMGKIGRENVVPLVEGNIELPNDISGIVYISNQNWQTDIAKEMNAVGYDIDFNKLYKTS